MLGKIVALLVVLVVSSFNSVDAVMCYQCNYTNSDSLGSSTCSDPFNATTTTASCSGSMCMWNYANYTSPSFNLVYRDCVNDSAGLHPDHCEQYTAMINHTTFRYGDSCCYSTGPTGDEGAAHSLTVCFCQKDNCNGDIPLTVGPSTATNWTTTNPKFTNWTTATSATTANSTNSMSLLMPSGSCSWALIFVSVLVMVSNFIPAR